MKPLVLIVALSAGLAAQESPLLVWMNSIAQQELDARDRVIGQIQDKASAAKRQEFVRAKVLQLIGGLPDYRGPLNAQVKAVHPENGYVIENVLFESLPGIFVTGNLYRPSAPGHYPGILIPLGHWEEGKPAVQRMATNFALKGFVVFTYDPLGQGERQQAYDWRIGGGLGGPGTTQHFMAGTQSILMGQSFARYRIWDAKRALDYLMSRPEVEQEKIGCTGCSGGGTLATYISALDPRIKVAAVSCFMQSFRSLFTAAIGDSEQSFPDFLASGLDETDYVESFAPKPWLITSTKDDFFTPAAAQQVVEEATKWYHVWDADNRVKWVVGPGPHGTPHMVREAIYEWMIRWLKDGHGDSTEQSVNLVPDRLLQVTPKGQVSLLPGSRDIYQVINQTPRSHGSQAELLEYLRKWMHYERLEPRIQSESKDASGVTHFVFEGDTNLNITADLYGSPNTHPSLILVNPYPRAAERAKKIEAAGYAVLVLNPRGVPEPANPPAMVGDWIDNTRAWLIGRNLPVLRAKDILRAIDLLELRGGKDINVVAREVPGIWALIAAAVDPRITKLWLDHTPVSFRPALESPLSTNLHDATMPGFALKWDIADMAAALGNRKLTWVDPTNWMRKIVYAGDKFVYRSADAGEGEGDDILAIPGLR
jgi:dienelactone hydrolase